MNIDGSPRQSEGIARMTASVERRVLPGLPVHDAQLAAFWPDCWRAPSIAEDEVHDRAIARMDHGRR